MPLCINNGKPNESPAKPGPFLSSKNVINH